MVLQDDDWLDECKASDEAVDGEYVSDPIDAPLTKTQTTEADGRRILTLSGTVTLVKPKKGPMPDRPISVHLETKLSPDDRFDYVWMVDESGKNVKTDQLKDTLDGPSKRWAYAVAAYTHVIEEPPKQNYQVANFLLQYPIRFSLFKSKKGMQVGQHGIRAEK